MRAASRGKRPAPDATVLLVYAIATLFNVGMMFLGLLVPLALLRLHMQPAALGLVVALPAALLFALRWYAGRATDRFGARAVLVTGTTLFACGALVLWRVPNLGGILAGQVLTGAGRAAFLPATQAQLYAGRDSASVARRAAAFNAAVGGGATVGAILAGAIQGRGLAISALVLLGVSATAVVAALLLPPRPARVAAAAAAPSGRLWRRLAPASLLAFISALPFVLIGSFYPVYGHDLGMSGPALGIVDGLRGIALIGAGLSFSLLLTRLGRHRLALTSLLVMAAAIAATPWTVGILSLGAAVLAANIAGAWVFNEATLQVVDRARPDELGTAFAVSGTAWSLSLLLAPAVLGLVAQHLGVDATFWACAGATGCTLALLSAARPASGPGAAGA